MSQDPQCLFCRIVRGEIASEKVYEDGEILAFRDIRPVRPVNVRGQRGVPDTFQDLVQISVRVQFHGPVTVFALAKK